MIQGQLCLKWKQKKNSFYFLNAPVSELRPQKSREEKALPENQETKIEAQCANRQGHPVFPDLCFLTCKMRALDQLSCKSLPILKPQDFLSEKIMACSYRLHNSSLMYFRATGSLTFILKEIKLYAIEYTLFYQCFVCHRNRSPVWMKVDIATFFHCWLCTKICMFGTRRESLRKLLQLFPFSTYTLPVF